MIIAGDLGYGNIKIFGERGGLVMPSLVATDGRDVVRTTALRRRKPPLHIQVGGLGLYVGLHAHDWGRPVESLDFDRFTGTPEMVGLWCGALSEYGIGSGEGLVVVAGMPLQLLSGEEAAVRERVNQVKGWLVGGHRWLANGEERMATVLEVRIASQADGTLFDYLLASDGSMTAEKRAEFRREMAILNIGMNTVDLLVSEAGAVKQKFTAGDTRGVRRLLNLVNAEGLWSLGELDTKLRAGSLDVGGGALATWGREVLGFVDDQWGKMFKRFGRVIAAGGGTVLLREQLAKRFGGKVVFPDDPVICTARGLYKYALMREKRGR